MAGKIKNIAIDRKGQVAIFVIVAIVMIAGVILFFIIRKNPVISRGQDIENPESFIDNCIREKSGNILDEMLSHGGFISPNDTVLYKGIKVVYLCKNLNYYKPCITQYPLYLHTLEKELDSHITEGVGLCFASLDQELTRRGYVVNGGTLKLGVTFKPGSVEIITDREMNIVKDGFTRTFNHFDTYLTHPVFELASTVQEIVSQEAKWCYFSNDGFMALYHDFDIKKDVLGDSTRIYSVTHKPTGKLITFAIRGCAIPAGF